MTLTGVKLRIVVFGGLVALGAAFIGLEKVTYTAAPASEPAKPLAAAAADAPVAAPYDTASLHLPAGIAYSFTQDNDNDGLSNAKELIYGTDPLNPDTDGDGYKDGAEVAHGFDPLVPGSAKLTDRPNVSLTIRYFTWAQALPTGGPDPLLDDTLIGQFFTSQHLTDFHLPTVPASDLLPANSTSDAVRQYLTKLSAVALPSATQDYSTLATASFQGQTTSAIDTADAITKAYQAIAAVPTPPQAFDLQRQYLGSLTVLAQLFRDLPRSQKDPVLIALDQRKGAWLKTQLDRLETAKEQLIATLQPPAAAAPTPAPTP